MLALGVRTVEAQEYTSPTTATLGESWINETLPKASLEIIWIPYE